MTGAVPPTSSTPNTMTDQNVPLSTKNTSMPWDSKSFNELIADFDRIQEDFNNQIKQLVSS
ncbi:MAG TPA: hypothetical protein VFU89_07385 [Rhabdochlamydiaceae bacterium]|nr:hypothetical protein [Rhabdochlamydiaceae bacterium]